MPSDIHDPSPTKARKLRIVRTVLFLGRDASIVGGNSRGTCRRDLGTRLRVVALALMRGTDANAG